MAALKQKELLDSQIVTLSFYTEHRDYSQASALASALYDEGFETDIDAFQQHLDIWRCWASVSITPTATNLQRVLNNMVELGLRYKGHLASWEVQPLTPNRELGQLLAKFEAVYQQTF